MSRGQLVELGSSIYNAEGTVFHREDMFIIVHF